MRGKLVITAARKSICLMAVGIVFIVQLVDRSGYSLRLVKKIQQPTVALRVVKIARVSLIFSISPGRLVKNRKTISHLCKKKEKDKTLRSASRDTSRLRYRADPYLGITRRENVRGDSSLGLGFLMAAGHLVFVSNL